jgi:hypothetical protein
MGRTRFGAIEGSAFPWDTGGMYTVELYAIVRRAVHVDGRSQREVAREFGLARKTGSLHQTSQIVR